MIKIKPCGPAYNKYYISVEATAKGLAHHISR